MFPAVWDNLENERAYSYFSYNRQLRFCLGFLSEPI